MDKYIGRYKIDGTFEQEDGNILIKLKDRDDLIVKKDLFDLITKDKEDKGEPADVINHVISVKFLSEMAEYGLKHYHIAYIAAAMQTLAHNLREELIKAAFNCDDGNSITVKQLIKGYEK